MNVDACWWSQRAELLWNPLRLNTKSINALLAQSGDCTSLACHQFVVYVAMLVRRNGFWCSNSTPRMSVLCCAVRGKQFPPFSSGKRSH